jgi:hypothetical protein
MGIIQASKTTISKFMHVLARSHRKQEGHGLAYAARLCINNYKTRERDSRKLTHDRRSPSTTGASSITDKKS